MASRHQSRSQSQLQLVRGIAQGREQKLANEVGELMRLRAEATATVQRLQGYLHDYQSAEIGSGARPLAEIENERRFVTRLNFALQQQCTHTRRLEESASAKMQLWQREHANLAALDRLVTRRAHAASRQQDRLEQKQADALSLRGSNKGAYG